MSFTISELRKAAHTQSHEPYPVNLTEAYDSTQVKQLINYAEKMKITLGFSVILTSPNGISSLVDYFLSADQVVAVSQVQPQTVELELTPPAHLSRNRLCVNIFNN